MDWVRTQLTSVLGALQHSKPSFDPRALGDPVAEQTKWGPLVRGGTRFRTHRLHQKAQGEIVFTASWGAMLFSGMFFVVGLAVVVGSFAAYHAIAEMEPIGLALGVLLGVVFVWLGRVMWRQLCVPRAFSKQHGVFWKGTELPLAVGTRQVSEDCVPLEDIHAVQLLREWIVGKQRRFNSYELNLVLRDGTRINVVDHGNIRRLRRDAQELAEFLGGVPVWDASR